MPDNRWRELFVIVSGIGLLCAVLFDDDVASADSKARQRRRERNAAALIATRGTDGRRFSLYLRPFASTGGVKILGKASTRKRGMTHTSMFGGSHVSHTVEHWEDLETVLADALGGRSPLVALGRPGEHIGAALVAVSDEEWQSLVRQLADRAELIFLLPSKDPGTAWELACVLQDPRLLAKTVVVLPGSGDAHAIITAAKGDGARLATELPRFKLAASRLGASRQPERSPTALMADARAALASAHVTGLGQLPPAPMGAFVRLTPRRSVRDWIVVQGYEYRSLINIWDLGPAFRLDRATLRVHVWKLLQAVRAESATTIDEQPTVT